MLDKENDKYSINQYFWEERSFSDSVDGCPNRYYYFPLAGELRLRKPPDVRGGMITEEMGLGKTVEALALIAAQKKEHERVELDIFCEKKPTGVSITQGRVRAMKMNQRNEDKAQMVFCPLNFGDEVLDYDPDVPYPKTLRVRRWPAKTTLVLCPTSLLEQWRTEAEERAPSLSLAEWGTGASSNTLRTTPDIAVGEFAKDIVLASYDALKRDSTLFKITWKRLILDEAQVTRRSSAQLARDTFNLRSESRFLMTGTPIVKGLEDLRGELAFLRVWPFTLFDDGFWERLIYCPFAAQESTAFIDHLLNVTMMRHSKAQQLSLELPPRSYEIIEVKLEGSYRAVYCYILGCCLEELDDENGPTDTCLLALRTLLRILLSACISPELLSLTALDLARRSTWSRRRGLSGSSVQSGGEVDLAKTTAEEAIQFLAETGTRIVRDSKRSRALPTGQGLPYEQYLRMNVDDLVTLVEARGLLSEVGGNFNQKRLAQLAAGGRHRIITDTLSQLRQTAIAAGLTTGVQSRALPRDSLISILTTHYDSVERRKAHGNIHEAGFAALTKLIEKKERPGCPVCMDSSVERLSLTKCGHFFCVTCISLMFRTLGESRVQCPICRRKILPKDAIEVVSSDKDELSETVAGSDDGSGLDQDLESPFSVTKVMTTISEADIERYRDAPRPTAAEVWEEYGQIASPHNRYLGVGRDSDLPSLDAEFLRHMKAATAHEAVSPKLDALHELIRTSEPGSKFCVVAETTDSLRGIGAWLEKQGIPVVGVGSRNWHMSQAHSLGRASQEFAKDPNIRVFMLNTANAAGLTLTAANCVVFMGPMVRITDEMQAAARVHRIGQQRPVRVVRIVARNTIEEQIMFRRGTIHGTGKEANALITPASELAVSDIVRLFRDVSTADEGRNLRRSARARARNQM
ncbi:unnamed protein product [Chondrus crispus]|uniref:Uncharacterized protein n=1 Tax=Chondrus crispus TaxID=2769 RepID=R7QAQ4_CHOCR|nr:unnamed protein product [Chondrus crispus]CDF35592.1 unnamed protein product [Chondrus crispus]|eukprot:XP_005715411.1 unnamed protein product [Chondrus crispus]